MTATGGKVSEGHDHWMVIGKIGGRKRIKGKWLLIFFFISPAYGWERIFHIMLRFVTPLFKEGIMGWLTINVFTRFIRLPPQHLMESMIEPFHFFWFGHA